MNHSGWILIFFIFITAFNGIFRSSSVNIVKDILRIAYLYEKIWLNENFLVFLHR